MITDVVTAAATGALVATGLGALYFARRQIDAARHDSKVDRTIDLHRDLTMGEVRLAKRRIAAMLWDAGERKYVARRVSKAKLCGFPSGS